MPRRTTLPAEVAKAARMIEAGLPEGAKCGYRDTRWCSEKPGTRYDCNSPRIGTSALDKEGGVIKACATPSQKKPGKGQWWVEFGLSGVGAAIPKSRVQTRLRDAKRGGQRIATDRADLAAYAHDYDSNPAHFPYPLGTEFPHRPGSSECDPEHPLWDGFGEALDRAQRTVAGIDEVPAYLAREPNYGQWEATDAKCVRAFRTRERKHRGKTEFGTAKQAAKLRTDAAQIGVDLGSAEYLDALRGGEGPSRKRKRK